MVKEIEDKRCVGIKENEIVDEFGLKESGRYISGS